MVYAALASSILLDFSRARQHVSHIVVVAGLVSLRVDGLLVGLCSFLIAAGNVVSFGEPGPDLMQVRILLGRTLLCGLKFRGGLIRKVVQFLFRSFALVRRRLLQFSLRCLLLLKKRHTCGEVLLHSFKLGLWFLRLSSLLPDIRRPAWRQFL